MTNINESLARKDEIKRMLIEPVNLTTEEILDHAKAFEQFRKAYRKKEAMEKNKLTLKQKMQEGR